MKKQIPLIGALVLPPLVAIILLLQNDLTFWYDPARDLLSAWDNLSKLTLIGPTSGIPGVFYGPYWIWLLSFGLLFSHNPIVVTFITATIPYMVLFPLLWFRLSKLFDRTSLILGWLLFILTTGMTYATELWNPYPAPLLTLATFVFLLTTDLSKITKRTLLNMLLAGFFLGLVVTFHLSFGIALVFGILLFYFCDSVLAFLQNKSSIRLHLLKIRLVSFLLFLLGVFVAFIPTLIFEARHGFHQIQTLLHTFTKYGAVVEVQGLNRNAIFTHFLATFGKLLHLHETIAGIVFLGLLCLVLYRLAKKHKKDTPSTRSFLLSLSVITGTALIYFTAKNPIWEYHFIGVEIPLLLFLTYAASKLPLFRKILAVWTVIAVGLSLQIFWNRIHHQETYFVQEEKIVKSIAADAKNPDYTVYAYSPSIYIYDYSYLFRWLTKKDIPYDPGQVKQVPNTVYLIVPPKKDAKVEDFIHFRAPESLYRREKIWYSSGGITVIKVSKRSIPFFPVSFPAASPTNVHK